MTSGRQSRNQQAILLAVVACAAGCGSARPPEAAADAADAGSPSSDADEADTTPPDSAGAETAQAPVVGHRLLAGVAVLAGSGVDACTKTPGDIWCAFAVPSRQGLVTQELWVMNVSKSIGASDVGCTTSTATCRLLSDRVESNDVSLASFTGDTLFFSADRVSSASSFIGTVYAWRPGWAAPRALTSATGLSCGGSTGRLMASCFQNLTTAAGRTTFELTAGKLDDPAGGPLPHVDQMVYSVGAEVPGDFPRYELDLAPDGSTLVWSTREDGDTEILKAQTLNDDSSRRVIAEDVSSWQLAPDGSRIFWLRAFNHDQHGSESGTLQMASFPGGADAVTLMDDVGEYGLLDGRALLVRAHAKGGVGDALQIPDFDDPGTTRLIDSGVVGVYASAPDGTVVSYARTGGYDGHDLYLRRADATAPCRLVSDTTAVGFPIASPHYATLVWAALGAAGTSGAGFDGFIAPVASCAPQHFTSNLISFLAMSDSDFLWQDDSTTGTEGTIRFGHLENGALPTAGTVIDTLASVNMAVLDRYPVVLYTVSSKSPRDGLYVSSTLPLHP